MKFNIQSWWKENSQKIVTEGHILNLTVIYKKLTADTVHEVRWEAKCFLPETRNKVRISTYIILIQHWAGNAFLNDWEQPPSPILVGSSLGSLSTLFMEGTPWWLLLHIPYPIQQQNLLLCLQKWPKQPSPLPVQVTTISCWIKAMGLGVVLLHLYPLEAEMILSTYKSHHIGSPVVPHH